MKEINQMTRKDFMSLPLAKRYDNSVVDSIILVPDKRTHDSGFSYFTVVYCSNLTPVGRLESYDRFSIYSLFENERIVIDCLNKSKCIRIILNDNKKYYINSLFYDLSGGRHERR